MKPIGDMVFSNILEQHLEPNFRLPVNEFGGTIRRRSIKGRDAAIGHEVDILFAGKVIEVSLDGHLEFKVVLGWFQPDWAIVGVLNLTGCRWGHSMPFGPPATKVKVFREPQAPASEAVNSHRKARRTATLGRPMAPRRARVPIVQKKLTASRARRA